MHYLRNGLIITIDGPAGAGKSTVANMIAQKLGYHYINTGDLYRYVTYCALQEKLDVKNSKAMDVLSSKVADQFREMNQKGKNLGMFLCLKGNVLDEIHSPEVDKNVSFVAQHPSVRKNLIPVQCILAKKGSVVMEGRDIGSVILPNADLKLFLTADEYTRILRRYEELKKKNYSISFQEVKEEMIRRDHIDSKREVAPLIKPKGAFIIDTSSKNINEVIETVWEIIQNHLKGNY